MTRHTTIGERLYSPEGSADDFQADLEREEAARKRRKASCRHRMISLIGNEETGLRDIRCHDCGEQMFRRTVGHEYVYETAAERDATDRLHREGRR